LRFNFLFEDCEVELQRPLLHVAKKAVHFIESIASQRIK